MSTDLYVKPTDKHQYLLNPSHPSHTKKSIPFSIALRLRRICSKDDFFNKRLNALTTHLINWGYKHCLSQQEINKVRFIPIKQPSPQNIHKTGIWQSTICNNIQSNPSQQGKTFEQTG